MWQYGTVAPFLIIYVVLCVAYFLSLGVDSDQVSSSSSSSSTLVHLHTENKVVNGISVTNTTSKRDNEEKHTLSPLRSVLILLAFPVVGILHLLTWLLTHWSVDVACLLLFQRVHDVKRAQFVKVVPVSHRGSKALCPLSPTLSFTYQKRTYTFDSSKGVFSKPVFPTSCTFQYYLSRTQGLSPQEVEMTRLSHGRNV